MTITKKKHFAETITIDPATPVSLATLLKEAGYGFEKDSDNNITTQPNLDSFTNFSVGVTPLTETLYAGHDQYVRDAAAVGPPRVYKGAPIDANTEYYPKSDSRGIISPSKEWFYSVGSQEVRIFTHGI